jgi:hypothetical protein
MSAAAKVTFMACRVAKLIAKLQPLIDSLEDLQDLGLDKLQQIQTKYLDKINELKDSVDELTDSLQAKIQALQNKMITLVTSLLLSIQKAQETLLGGIEEMLESIAGDYEGVSIQVNVTNDYAMETTTDGIITSGGFGIEVTPSIELLNCDTNLLDVSLIALRTLPAVVGVPSLIDPTSVTL